VLAPDRVVVLERARTTEIAETGPEQAARALVCGTYAAGELRRYWAFAATLAAGTDCGPAHPPVARVAAALADRLPAAELVLTGRAAGDPVALLAGTAALQGGVS
jgi:hypothetical protein